MSEYKEHEEYEERRRWLMIRKRHKQNKMENKKLTVMVNGLPGKMATEVANKMSAIHNLNLPIGPFSEFNLIAYSLTGPEIKEYCASAGLAVKKEIILIKPDKREEQIKKMKNNYGNFISVDFTQPDSVNENADFYCRHELPFVMGTTGGDRKALEERVKNSDICAVIAPNMAKQIVAFQSLMENIANVNPGALKGCALEIVESHQQGKKDTSGTAKAMVSYFNKLGIPFTAEQIEMIRDPAEQREIGIPEEYLRGHAWHTYEVKVSKENIEASKLNEHIIYLKDTLKDFLENDKVFSDYESKSYTRLISPILERQSKDKTVTFSVTHWPGVYTIFSHRVNGRSIYADGTLDAIKFLDKKVQAGEKGRVYSMIDVLKEGK